MDKETLIRKHQKQKVLYTSKVDSLVYITVFREIL